ncbi:MAG: hypothetical protein HPZ91_17035 [Lentisphaeria bacterium]|nr:hypothetical protein [Lentisphaeria bacterium]
MTYYDDDERPKSVAELKSFAGEVAKELEAEGRKLSPVSSAGRSVAKSFWGKAWCRNIESYQDYESRLPRGRSYLKNGTVIDLGIEPGKVTALVVGSELYRVSIVIDPVRPERWEELKRKCAGRIDSLVDLIEGRLSEPVIALLCDPGTGLFPAPEEIHMSCDCPDWAGLCKHLAAVLYGIGTKLDADPGLFFVLRGVDQSELFMGDLSVIAPETGAEFDDLADTFGIELD